MPPETPIDLREHLRDVPDFPRPGILFKDITPLLAHPAAFRATIDQLATRFAGRKPDLVAAAEAPRLPLRDAPGVGLGRRVRADPQARQAAV